MPQVRRRGFAQRVEAALAGNDLPPYAIELEITESLAMEEPKMVVHSLQALKAIGLRIAIDDFGTGYSSLAHLREMPIDCLKIDRTFISEIADGQGGMFAETIIALGQKLGVGIVAEGSRPGTGWFPAWAGLPRRPGLSLCETDATRRTDGLAAGAFRVTGGLTLLAEILGCLPEDEALRFARRQFEEFDEGLRTLTEADHVRILIVAIGRRMCRTVGICRLAKARNDLRDLLARDHATRRAFLAGQRQQRRATSANISISPATFESNFTSMQHSSPMLGLLCSIGEARTMNSLATRRKGGIG